MRTPRLAVIVLVTMGLAACSSSANPTAGPLATLPGSPTTASSALTSTSPPSSAKPVESTSAPGAIATTVPSPPPLTLVAPSPSAPTPVPGLPVQEWADATGSPPPPATHAVTAFGAVACPSPELGGGAGGSASPLAASAHITAVVRCETVQRSYPGLGTWLVQLAEVADTDLGPFLAALRAPSDARRTDLICPDLVILVPWFGLVDDAGNVMRPVLPTDACGKPRTAVIAALQALQFRVTAAVRVQRSS